METGAIGEQFVSDYSVYEIPSLAKKPSTFSQSLTSADTQLINHALLACLELPEAENSQLKADEFAELLLWPKVHYWC